MEKTFDLEKIGKRMPYSVPDDFFDNMEKNVMEEVSKTKRKIATPHFDLVSKKALRIALRSILAVAAAVALFFVVQPLLSKSDTVDFESVELAFNNLSADDQDFLIQVYEEDNLLFNP